MGYLVDLLDWEFFAVRIGFDSISLSGEDNTGFKVVLHRIGYIKSDFSRTKLDLNCGLRALIKVVHLNLYQKHD